VGGVFAGKFTFQSTNATGARFFLTPSPQSNGSVYPAVLAPAATPTERIIAYTQQDGSIVLCMAVTNRLLKTVSLAWMKSQAELGFVTSDPLPGNATPLRITPSATGTGNWAIANPGGWIPLCYQPNGDMSLLLFCSGTPPAGMLATFDGACVTPGYGALKQPGNGIKADLAYTDLSGLDLSGVDFTGAVLNGTIFHDATLTGAVFTGATMAKTELTGRAVLDGAVMSRLDLSSVVWGSTNSAVGTHFEGSVLVGCQISTIGSPAKLSGAFFNNADLAGAHLAGADLTSATLYGANLTGAVLDSADLSKALLGGSTAVRPATLAYALMSNVVLTQANLFGVDFTAVTLFGARTKANSAATIEGADFSNAYLEGVSFANSNLQGARFDNACLISADFTGASLGASSATAMAASFAGACLAGASFPDAQIDGVNFANAFISVAKGSVPVRYCTATGMLPPPPNTIPINCRATTGLDLTTLCPATICPNGSTLATNQTRDLPLSAMLVAPGAPNSWFAPSCIVASRTDVD
jgi:uncharacterized protein YjbI with pentapeptide repeats